MGLTDNLRKQHKELLKTAVKIAELTKSDDISREVAEQIYDLLSELNGCLHFHLKMEDELFYPALLRHPDDKIVKKTRQFQEEMGGLLDEFNKYINKWTDAAAVRNNSDEFNKKTRKIFNALAYRIEKEDNELYPLVER